MEERNLRDLRNSIGLTRKFVAEKLHVNPDHVTKIETGTRRLTQVNAEILASLYSVNYSELTHIANKVYLNRQSKKYDGK
ncbi:helix-turn-helix domain-containing protein [Clostridium felsineum]|uniref:helix-turn-helix domain-containing protein n=1 Tax=Clostridium felsineum TaxID=36839 RepID=UPI00098C9632|nr:helix-turn-helix transcriptional regulator [Clostridium felsineum]URZ15402.1 hypothetical protein CLFE_014420 [Clostridium felsineum DSM 794]